MELELVQTCDGPVIVCDGMPYSPGLEALECAGCGRLESAEVSGDWLIVRCACGVVFYGIDPP